MSFLQPAILWAIPLIALPIVIHLINQRRFQTVHWAAMHFLLAANRMSRGYARLRQWLILAARTLAIAGLVFAISRPLSSGWLGLTAGGRVDTTIILLDRSASMGQLGPGGASKLQSGLQRLAASLRRLDSDRYVLIESGRREPIELATPEAILDMPETRLLSESADVPDMLEVAAEYLRANRPSRCEIWICSDVRRSDWQDHSGRWEAIRSTLEDLPQQIRYHLLAYPQPAGQNRSIRGTRVQRVESADGPRLLISFRIEQPDAAQGSLTVPVQLEINGGRSEFTVEMSGSVLEVRDHTVPIDEGKQSGWGRLSIPTDASPGDNEFYFVYDKEPVRRTLVVTERPEAIRPIEFAAAVSPEGELEYSVEVFSPEQLIGVELSELSLLVWHAAIPVDSDPNAALLIEFAGRGGRLLFLPPASPTDASFAGVSWGNWSDAAQTRVVTWVGDRDLLANTRSGEALPVGELLVARSCALQGEYTSLATLDQGQPLLVRAMTAAANVYFCATTTSAEDTSLASAGVVLYAMIQRAIEAGARTVGSAQQYVAGAVPLEDSGHWRQLLGPAEVLSSQYSQQAGVYETADRMFAINRSEAEDRMEIVPDERVQSLFGELDFTRVDDVIGKDRSLIQEVWRLFLVLMLLALLLEAALCLPRRVVKGRMAFRDTAARETAARDTAARETAARETAAGATA